MTALAWVMVVSVLIAFSALSMTIINFRYYRRPGDPGTEAPEPSVSVCVPARNEEANLGPLIDGLRRARGVDLEVLIYDDQSTDATGRVLAELVSLDPRVRRVPTHPLPPGWVGKQWACWQAAQSASKEWLLFTDADVRFEPDALRLGIAQARRLRADLISSFPRQITGTIGESVIVPMIHFVLFSYLPMGRMRRSRDPASSAGCGQFLLARREAYFASGGHGAFPGTMHDGVKMPRSFRRAGFHTDLFDATALVSCRMYRGLAQTWRGFAKNAYEGLGSAWLLAFITALHVVGHLLPWGVLVAAALDPSLRGVAPVLGMAAILGAYAQRALLARRFDHPLASVLLHPLGVLAMTVIQWHSLGLTLSNRRSWKGRLLAPASAGPPG
ncbi:MAG TPA: glycosyl transferase [Phycisphaerales bacterium]|nr:glycosyl transferase [Phycisphaerales bacterium]